MSSLSKQSLSIWDRVVISTVFGRALCVGLTSFLFAPFRGGRGARSIIGHVEGAMTRATLARLNVKQMRALYAPVDAKYQAFAKKRGFTPTYSTLADGTKAYWIGSKTAEKVVVWFHGGGYCLPMETGHMTFAGEIFDAAGDNVAVVLPTYDLAPDATYPRQLTQGVGIVRHLLDELEKKPSNIILGGDSAGGNLALGILSHISHPHSSIPPLRIATPFRGLVILGVWASFEATPSYQTNLQKDIVTPYTNGLWASSFLGGSRHDPYNQPLTADPEWWRDIKTEQILVVGSNDEIYRDEIISIANKLKAAKPSTEVIMVDGERHAQPTMTFLRRGGQQGEAIKSWIRSRMGGEAPMVNTF